MIEKTRGDITKMKADVIINAANTQLYHGGGVARQLVLAGGEIVEKESAEVGFCPLGSFAITSAGDLPAKKIIHIPTIDYIQGHEKISYEDLEKAWRDVLQWSISNDHVRINVPLLGTGVVGLNKNKVEDLLERVAEEFPELIVKIVMH